jgi:hypothetical protein
LYNIEALRLAVREVHLDLVTIKLLHKQPTGIALPEKWFSVFVLQVSSVLRNDKSAVTPGRLAEGAPCDSHEQEKRKACLHIVESYFSG